MSEVKRYSLTLHKVKGKFESPEFERDNGEWVKFEDYARLKAEVERLRNAGDAVCESPYALETDPAVIEWRAAKEGKPTDQDGWKMKGMDF